MKSLPLLSVYLRSQGRERRMALKDTSLRPWWNRGHPSCPAPGTSPAITCVPLMWGPRLFCISSSQAAALNRCPR